METSTLTPMRAFQAGAVGLVIGAVGGLIGLGGAEFRLPLLIGLFGFPVLRAVVLNKAMSLVVVACALLARSLVIPFSEIASHWDIVANLLLGSLLGAWFGANWAVKAKSETLHRIIAILLALIALVLVLIALLTTFGHSENFGLPAGLFQQVVGTVAGFGVGIVAAILGVAGGELLIPSLILIFGIDMKLAGSLSLAISLPTMLVAFARYSQDKSFNILIENKGFSIVMAVGSVVGTIIGGRLLGVIPSSYLLPSLAVILILSARKVWKHAS